MFADCGFLDNIAYDYENGVLTPDYEIKQMCDSLTFDEQARLVKSYNLAKVSGAGSSDHFKLVIVACEIIRDNLAKYVKYSICPSPVKSSRKYFY